MSKACTECTFDKQFHITYRNTANKGMMQQGEMWRKIWQRWLSNPIHMYIDAFDTGTGFEL